MINQLSVAVRNAMLDAFETAIGASPILKIRSGAVPANCAAADSGTVIATINLGSDWMAGASGGSKAFNSTPLEDASADALGMIGHYRLYASDGVTCHDQGDISYTAAAWQATTAYVLGQKVKNGGRVYNCSQAGTSAGSGGPTGTGTNITDNTARWDYVSEVGSMEIDNLSVTAGQKVGISSWTKNMGGHA